MTEVRNELHVSFSEISRCYYGVAGKLRKE